jgi:hypothetical protein
MPFHTSQSPQADYFKEMAIHGSVVVPVAGLRGSVPGTQLAYEAKKNSVV